ncbi:DUF4376 domain-containing protein [Roseovarius nitratireducens]|uniref:DUF4376 domain-containing protein n=1 Tax=Roseovarius nitratireducens TaxID=2044597 RepID=UPI00101AE73D|nr:DUF4376 domain-containing protein [Roseovarius nitratireducens]
MIYSYTTHITTGPNGAILRFRNTEDQDATVLGAIGGATIVHVPDGVTMPAQPAEIGWAQVTLSDADRTTLSRTSPVARRIKERRDKAMIGGVIVNGISIATDDLSQQRITGAALAAQIDSTTTVQWKMPDSTFAVLDAAQITGIAQAVRAHVQACFDREAELLSALFSGEPYDIETGWP